MKHAVDERGTFHDVAHEDKQRHRQERVISHDAVSALHHQVEDPILPPMMRRIPECDVTENHAESHERKCSGKAHHDRDHNEPEHGQAEYWIAHGLFCLSSLIALSCTTPSSITLRWRAASSMACAVSIAARRDSSSTYSLWESWVPITSISSTSSKRAGQAPVLMHRMQRTISARP